MEEEGEAPSKIQFHETGLFNDSSLKPMQNWVQPEVLGVENAETGGSKVVPPSFEMNISK